LDPNWIFKISIHAHHLHCTYLFSLWLYFYGVRKICNTMGRDVNGAGRVRVVAPSYPTRKENWCKQVGNWFHGSIEKGEKYFHELISCSLSSRHFCYPEKPNFLLSLATIQAIKDLVMIACL